MDRVDTRTEGCIAFSDSLIELRLHAAAYIVRQGVQNPTAVDAVAADIEAPGISSRGVLRALLMLYRTGQFARLSRAVAAWDRRDCEGCALCVATGQAAEGDVCEDCADLDAMTVQVVS